MLKAYAWPLDLAQHLHQNKYFIISEMKFSKVPRASSNVIEINLNTATPIKYACN